MHNKVSQHFENAFGCKPSFVVRSPGRINLIGEHTDYNMGFVLPAAIDKAMYFAMSKRSNSKSSDSKQSDSNSEIISLDFDAQLKTDFNSNDKEKSWYIYLFGCVQELEKIGLNISSIQCVFGGDIPIGAGLSSSAALTCGFLFGLNELFELNLEREQICQLAQKVEHNYAGVKCGIMDQFANMMGEDDHFVKLDCRSLEYKKVSAEIENYSFVLCDTQVKHNLAASEYNKRRQECEEGVRIMRQSDASVHSLRDASLGLLEKHRDGMTSTVYERCLYIISENSRVNEVFAYLLQGQFDEVGEKLYESHLGLKDYYHVSCSELDYLVDIARSSEGVAGARMMGGGFGGCTLNLIQNQYIDSFIKNCSGKYLEKFGRELKIYTAVVANGTSLIA